MKGKRVNITNENFEYALYSADKKVNLSNKDYINEIKKMYFSKAEDGLTLSKAIVILRSILRERSYNGKGKKDTFYGSRKWNALGYYTDVEIRTAIFKYYKNSPYYSKLIFKDDECKIKDFIIKHLKVFNFENVEFYNQFKERLFRGDVCFVDTCAKERIESATYYNCKAPGTVESEIYWICRGFDLDYAKARISESQRMRSKRCVDYYTSRGYDEEYAKNEVSKSQKKYCNQSKGMVQYWLNLGFDEESAKEKAYEFQIEKSVWAKTHWMSLGYSEKEAEDKALEYNSSSEKFKLYRENRALYVMKIKRCSDNAIKRWKSDEYRKKQANAIKRTLKSPRNISKEENECFDFLINNVNKKIKHDPYVVEIPHGSSKTLNLYFYVCDGYIKTKYGNVIIIEYDGEIYHDENLDYLRDGDIMDIDDNVLGVVRITSNFYKQKIMSSDEKIKKIKDAIQEITNSPKTRIVL